MHQDLKPGRELDALVAEHVMGWSGDDTFGWIDSHEIEIESAPHYSTDIAAAWEVVEKLAGKPYPFELTNLHGGGYTCRFTDHEASADTAPHAICLAALKACGVNGGEG